MRTVDSIQRTLTLLLIVLLPWQARYIFFEDTLNGVPWEPGTFSIYLIDALIFIILIVSLFSYLLHRPKLTRERFFMVLLMLLFLIWLLVSLIFSTSPALSLVGGVSIVTALTLFYITATSALSLTAMVGAMSIGVAWSAIVGMLQFSFQEVAGSTLLGIATQSAIELGSSVVETGGVRFLRTYGPLSHPNVFGSFLSLGILSLIYITLTTKKRRIRIPILAGIPLFVITLLTTASRSALVGFFIASFFFFIYLFAKHPQNISSKQMIKVLSTVIVSFVLFSAILSSVLIPRVVLEGRLEDMSYSDRAESYFLWPRVVADTLFIGRGPNTYRYALSELDGVAQKGWAYQPVHSSYLLVIAEMGIVGFSFLLLFFIQSMRHIRLKQTREDVTARLLISFVIVLSITALFDHYWWSSHFGVLLLFFIAGLLYRFNLSSNRTQIPQSYLS